MAHNQVIVLDDEQHTPIPSIATIEVAVEVRGFRFTVSFIYDIPRLQLIDRRLKCHNRGTDARLYSEALMELYTSGAIPNHWQSIRDGLFLERKPVKFPTPIAPDKHHESARSPLQGYVYLIQSPSGHYKIGCARNPDNRIKMFEVKLPFEIELVAKIPSMQMRKLESELHRKFASKRVGGEWFALDAEDVAYIQGLQS